MPKLPSVQWAHRLHRPADGLPRKRQTKLNLRYIRSHLGRLHRIHHQLAYSLKRALRNPTAAAYYAAIPNGTTLPSMTDFIRHFSANRAYNLAYVRWARSGYRRDRTPLLYRLNPLIGFTLDNLAVTSLRWYNKRRPERFPYTTLLSMLSPTPPSPTDAK